MLRAPPTMSLVRYFQSYYRRNLPSIGVETHSRQLDVASRYEGPSMLQQRSFKHDRADTSRNIDVPQANPGSIPPTPPSGGPLIFNWMKLAMGSIFTFVLPFLYTQWKNILKIAGEIETAKEAVEKTAEVVEHVAEMAEKASEEVADNLKDGKLKAAVEVAEHILQEVEDDARIVEDIIHKVDEIEEDVKTLIEFRKHDDGDNKHDEKRPQDEPDHNENK